MIYDEFLHVSMEEIGNSSVEIVDYPSRNEQILRNFEIILPKFHFILPNFYFAPPWGNSVCSLAIPDFLGRNETNSKMHGRTRRVTVVGTHGTSNLCRDARSVRPLCQSETSNLCRDARSCVRCVKARRVTFVGTHGRASVVSKRDE